MPTEIRLHTFNESMEEYFQYRDRMDKDVRVDDDGYVVLRDSYNIALDRIPDEKALMAWVYHLTGKIWFDRDMCREFIVKVSSVKGFNVHLAV